MEVLFELVRGALRDRRERRLSIGINEPLEARQQCVVRPTVHFSKKTGWPRVPGSFLTGEFVQSTEHNVNDNNVGIDAIDSRRYSEIKRTAVKNAVPPSKKPICK